MQTQDATSELSTLVARPGVRVRSRDSADPVIGSIPTGLKALACVDGIHSLPVLPVGDVITNSGTTNSLSNPNRLQFHLDRVNVAHGPNTEG